VNSREVQVEKHDLREKGSVTVTTRRKEVFERLGSVRDSDHLVGDPAPVECPERQIDVIGGWLQREI
jgi:hypothetical protein